MINFKISVTEDYEKLVPFFIENELEFSEEAVRAIAQKAIKLNTGARGLRTIVENAVLGLMYDVPSDKTISTPSHQGDPTLQLPVYVQQTPELSRI